MSETLSYFHELICEMLKQGKSYSEISASLVQRGVLRGASVAAVRKYCHDTGINVRADVLSDDMLHDVVSTAVYEVGPSFGRKMMTGYFNSIGVRVSERRLGRMLRQVHEPYHQTRRQGARNMNPIPYHAEYFGHKLHIDQNEKLGMFGVVHVVAVDGYSSKIVTWKSMPAKNNLIIYESVYRQAVQKYGLWDQIRVDHGTEFYLSLYMQEKIAALRTNTARLPYIQTQSRNNHTVERIWPEINQRVNYPIKSALVQLVDNDSINVEDDLTKFCISNLCIKIAEIGVQQVVESWNSHRIPGKGIPNVLAGNTMTASVPDTVLPDASVAANWYSDQLGTVLTAESKFGRDPFQSEDARLLCESQFHQQVPALRPLFTSCLHGQYEPLQSALLRLIDLTSALSV